MPHLKLKIVSGSEAGQNDNYSFTQLGGSIGRAEECDWTLLDSDRFVSKKHLVISFRNQQFILTDVSSNGVIVNNSGASLGRGNEHTLQANDTLVIGKHIVQVEDIGIDVESANPFQQSDSDGDLLGLVMGADLAKNPLSTPVKDPLEAFQATENQNPFTEPKPKSDQGLEDILSQPIQSPVASDFSSTNEQSNPFNITQQPTSPFDTQAISEPSGIQSNAADSLIPDDWELFETKSNNDTFEPAKVTDNPQSFDNIFGNNSADEPLTQAPPSQNAAEFLNKESLHKLEDTPPEEVTPKPIEMPTPQATPEPAASASQVAPNQTASHSENDDFFDSLYEKLGLSKEFKTNINRETFAEDIATILLSTTQGLMSLLASRTAFKQESRLSSTLIQPRSNNPIKFSIDPVDTLEMLLVKKKKGYMSVGDSYDEAMEDIQLHQMAFMSGLQGTLNGVIAQLDPQDIEDQVNKKSQRFMGLNSNSQCWQIYKEKQPLLAKSVKENLNEVLGNYFSDAYQSQINSFKKEK